MNKAVRIFAAICVIGGVGFWLITGEPLHHHKTGTEACRIHHGAVSEDSRVEGGTPQDPDVYHFYTCADGAKVAVD